MDIIEEEREEETDDINSLNEEHDINTDSEKEKQEPNYNELFEKITTEVGSEITDMGPSCSDFSYLEDFLGDEDCSRNDTEIKVTNEISVDDGQKVKVGNKIQGFSQIFSSIKTEEVNDNENIPNDKINQSNSHMDNTQTQVMFIKNSLFLIKIYF